MHPINLGLVFVAGLNVGLALLIWLRNPKNKINITFASAVFFLATWAFGMAMFREAETEQIAWVWTWIQNGSGALIVIPFFLFSLYFPYQDKVLKKWQVVLIGLSIIVMLLIVIIPGAWTKEINLAPPDNSYSLNKWGIAYFNIHLYFYLFLAFYNFIIKYLSNQGFIRKQLLYLILTTGVISIFGSIFAAFIPLAAGRLGPYWLGPYFSLPMIVFLTMFIYKKD